MIETRLLKNEEDFRNFLGFIDENMDLEDANSLIDRPRCFPSIVCWNNEGGDGRGYFDYLYIFLKDFQPA